MIFIQILKTIPTFKVILACLVIFLASEKQGTLYIGILIDLIEYPTLSNTIFMSELCS